MPASKTDLHQTRPRRPSPLPHHRAPAARSNPSRHPFHPHPPGRDRPCYFHPTLTTLVVAALTISPTSVAWPTPITAPDPDMSKVTTCAANTARPPTILCASRRRRPLPSHHRSPRTALCRARQP